MTLERPISTFTLEKLEKYNGQGGKLSYVAVNGEVYEVSASPMWGNGLHAGLHRAGCDLTGALLVAPHGKGVFERFKKVGVLVSAPDATESTPRRVPPAWASKLISIHSHPIAAHFPQAFFVFAPIRSLGSCVQARHWSAVFVLSTNSSIPFHRNYVQFFYVSPSFDEIRRCLLLLSCLIADLLIVL